MARQTRSQHLQAPNPRSRKSSVEPALQIICLAAGGGPAEDNVTGFLVRSLSTSWSKHSVLAVDAGSHLASITRILESDFPRVSSLPEPRARNHSTTSLRANGAGRHSLPADAASDAGYESSDSEESVRPMSARRVLDSGPFAGLPFPFDSARANALHVVRECISTYLITHPHLDHVSAFAINTAAFHNTSRPKTLAALPSTVNAIKTHIFNNIIWPNLTDEDGGVGFVTLQRLAEGGNVAVGDGRRKGFIEVCDGLCVKGLKVSHGHCMKGPSAAHGGSEVGLSQPATGNPRSPSLGGDGSSISPKALKRLSFSLPQNAGIVSGGGASTPNQQDASTRGGHGSSSAAVVDSTAFFIQDDSTGREILIFGDVEPDAISLSPRTAGVWAEAAPKVANGHLRAVVIECSYDDSQADAVLFGHLAPRWLIKELCALAEVVRLCKAERRASRKRKRSQRISSSAIPTQPDLQLKTPDIAGKDDTGTSHFEHVVSTKKTRSGSTSAPADGDAAAADHPVSPHTGAAAESPFGGVQRTSSDGLSSGAAGTGSARPSISLDHAAAVSASADANSSFQQPALPAADAEAPPLAGLTVVVMHVKDTFRDGPLVGNTILVQLQEHEARLREQDGVGLGCEFVISQAGESYLF